MLCVGKFFYIEVTVVARHDVMLLHLGFWDKTGGLVYTDESRNIMNVQHPFSQALGRS